LLLACAFSLTQAVVMVSIRVSLLLVAYLAVLSEINVIVYILIVCQFKSKHQCFLVKTLRVYPKTRLVGGLFLMNVGI
jgi:hypothetical protein